jgi:gas vesicle protein
MNYQNGKIYTIRSYQTDKYYIGSTASTLTKRLSGHKTNNKNKPSTSKIITDLGDSYIELLELFPCNSKIELTKREGELQRLYKDDIVNKRVECRTVQEYYMDNADKIQEYRQEYYKKNTDKLKSYRKDNADKIQEYQQEHYKKNAEKIKEYQLEYYKNNIDNKKEHYKKNADEINKKRREKYKLKLKK